MLRKAALFFSVIIHPLLIPLAGILILFFSGSFISFIPPQAKKIIILLFITGTILLPLFMFTFLWFRGVNSNFLLEERSERIFPFAVTFIFYLFTYLILLRIPVYKLVHSFMLGGLISLLILILLSFKWKISAHMTGLGGLTAFILIVSYKLQINLIAFFILAVIASGITATSRLILKAHNPVEVYTGFVMGCIVMLGAMIWG